MYNFRYHIASLVAVFLALSIGLLLGTIVVERGILDSQRDAIVGGLQEEFRSLAEENALLRDEAAVRESYVTDTLPTLITEKLDGRTVIVMAGTGRTDGLGAVSDAITQAGGVPVTMTFNDEGLGLATPEVQEAISEIMGARTEDEWEPSVVASLAAEWASPQLTRPVTDALVAAGVASMGELPPESRVDGAIAMVAWDEGPDESALSIAQAVDDGGAIGMGAEALTDPTGVAVAAAERGLSAVDDVTRVEGQYSLVIVLAGEAAGHFGEGGDAQAPYPPPALPE